MPIIAIHGTNVRDPNWARDEGILDRLRLYVAPAIQRGATCTIIPVYWGDDGVVFYWNHQSTPGTSPVSAAAASARARAVGDPVLFFLTAPAQRIARVPRAAADTPVGDVTEPALIARFHTALAARIQERAPDEAYAASAAAITGAIGNLYDAGRPQQTFTYQNVEEAATRSLTAQSIPIGWLTGIADIIVRAIEEADRGDALGLAKALLGYRQPLNDAVTTLFGDVFVYLSKRGTPQAPGPILLDFLTALRAAADEKAKTGEPIVVLSHSQGGQIVYDALASVVGSQPDYAGINVDLWCAAGCQVGLFEEMKLFWSSKTEYSAANGNKAPSPPASVLGTWVTCWDPTDVLSYTTSPIFDRVVDVSFESGWAPPLSHQGYLDLPEFYQRLHNVILNPTVEGWNALLSTP
jgi:hypothetical protein